MILQFMKFYFDKHDVTILIVRYLSNNYKEVNKSIMNEVNMFYINVYNLFISLNQSVDTIITNLNIDLSYSQYTLLKFISIHENKKVTQKQLDEWSSLRKPSISQLLKVLVMKEYILHYPMNNDIRCKEIALTNKAIISIQQIDCKMEELLLKKMEINDISLYTKTLRSIKEIIESEEGSYAKKISSID